jgi:Tfp pilus assembly protein PilF
VETNEIELYSKGGESGEDRKDDRRTITHDAIHLLGDLYASQGKLVEAEQMYQRALHGKEKAWGPDHTLTLRTVNNLAVLYAGQGKLVEAEQMYQRAL